MDYYSELLSNISANCKDLPPYKPLAKYNIFNVLGVNAKEVIMCRFLADLLNPEGQHGCGTLFLRSFLENILDKHDLSHNLLAHTEVITEFLLDNDRRIDIVIKNTDFFIPIEVKIYAEEQEGQCFDYYKKAKNSKIIYLTRFGNIPSEYSRKKNETDILPLSKIHCISWAYDICDWLTEILVQLEEPIKSIIAQFIDTIHIIADGRDSKLMNKNIETLKKSPEYFMAGIQIEKSMKEAKLQLIQAVFDDFKSEMENITTKYGLEIEKDAHYYSYDDEYHKKFYDCYSTFPGLNYIIKKAKFSKSSLQMWFRIEIEHNLFAGICLFDTEAITQGGNTEGYQVNDITDSLIDEASKYLDRDIIAPEDWWFTWCYTNGTRCVSDDVPDFKNMNQSAINLIDKDIRKEFVKNAVKVFEDCILKYET